MNLVPLKFRAKIIPDYYVHVKTGDIYSSKRSNTHAEKLTATYDVSNGYMNISICSPGIKRSQRIHRLVAETLIPFPCPEGIPKADWKATPQSVKNELCSQYRVNHIDHDKTNYHPSNLEWVTAKGNSQAYIKHKNATLAGVFIQ
jgi:hypothetical protein